MTISSRQLRLAYLAPEVLKQLTCGREATAVTVMHMTECAALSWHQQAAMVFGGTPDFPKHYQG